MLFRSRKDIKYDFLEADEVFFDALQEDRIGFGTEPLEAKITRKGFWLVIVGTSLFVAVIFYQLINLTFFDGPALAQTAQRAHIYNDWRPTGRGLILDDAGKALVANEAVATLYALPHAIPINLNSIEDTLARIANSIKISPESLRAKLVNIDRKSTTALMIKDSLEPVETIYLKELLRDSAAFMVQTTARRVYFKGPTFAQIIGYTGKARTEELGPGTGILPIDVVGRSGLEAWYDAQLRGEHGLGRYLVNSLGQRLELIDEKDPKTGATLKTTINSGLEEVVYGALERGVKRAGARVGAVVVLNPQDGSIRALASTPTFDNNLFGGSLSESDYKSLFDSAEKPLFNRAISGVYPPASTVKPIVGVAALNEGIIDPQKKIFVTGSIAVASDYDKTVKYVFRDWKAHGWVDFQRALAVSSNVYFYTLGGGYDDIKGLGIERLAKYMRAFNLGAKTNIDLPGEQSGTVPDPAWKAAVHEEPWYIGDTYHQAIGQGDLRATPLQVALYTAGVANNGLIYRPHLVTNLNSAPISPELLDEVKASETAFEQTKAGMRLAVTEGSARALKNIDLMIAGKTGTAQPGGDSKNHAWFTSFAPYDNPKIVVTVLVEHGGEGNETAVPIAREIYEWLAANYPF